MRNDTSILDEGEEAALRYEVSGEDVEAAAAEIAMSCTHHRSAYNRCCR